MNQPRRRLASMFLGLAASVLTISGLLISGSASAQAQPYPNRPVRIIVAYPPGGITDIVARLVAQRLTDSLKQPFVVENKAGSNGMIGSELAVRSAPDGYTILFGTNSLASNPYLYAKLPYDAAKDLAPIAPSANAPYFMAISADLPIKTVKEFIAYAKARPGQLNYATAGAGSAPHLAAELFSLETGIKMTGVPYGGTAPGALDVAAGRVQLIFVGIPVLQPLVQAGKIRLLGVADTKRSPVMPEMPTIAESGLPGFEAGAWLGFFAPAGTPRDIRVKLAAEISTIMQTKDMQDRLAGMGAGPMWGTVDQFETSFREEGARFAKVIKAANVKMN